MPIISVSLLNRGAHNGFVNMSASMFSLLQYRIFTMSEATFSLTKWYLIDMCFVLPWYCWFLLMEMVDWLSSNIVTVFSSISSRSEMSLSNQIASCTALARAMYSASAVESATQVCSLLLQLIVAPLS